EPLTLGGHLLLVRLRAVVLEGFRVGLAHALARLALGQDEAPGNGLAVVGHAGGDGQKSLDLVLRGAGLAEPAGRDRTSLAKAGKAVIHRVSIRLRSYEAKTSAWTARGLGRPSPSLRLRMGASYKGYRQIRKR